MAYVQHYPYTEDLPPLHPTGLPAGYLATQPEVEISTTEPQRLSSPPHEKSEKKSFLKRMFKRSKEDTPEVHTDHVEYYDDPIQRPGPQEQVLAPAAMPKTSEAKSRKSSPQVRYTTPPPVRRTSLPPPAYVEVHQVAQPATYQPPIHDAYQPRPRYLSNQPTSIPAPLPLTVPRAPLAADPNLQKDQTIATLQMQLAGATNEINRLQNQIAATTMAQPQLAHHQPPLVTHAMPPQPITTSIPQPHPLPTYTPHYAPSPVEFPITPAYAAPAQPSPVYDLTVADMAPGMFPRPAPLAPVPLAAFANTVNVNGLNVPIDVPFTDVATPSYIAALGPDSPGMASFSPVDRRLSDSAAHQSHQQWMPDSTVLSPNSPTTIPATLAATVLASDATYSTQSSASATENGVHPMVQPNGVVMPGSYNGPVLNQGPEGSMIASATYSASPVAHDLVPQPVVRPIPLQAMQMNGMSPTWNSSPVSREPVSQPMQSNGMSPTLNQRPPFAGTLSSETPWTLENPSTRPSSAGGDTAGWSTYGQSRNNADTYDRDQEYRFTSPAQRTSADTVICTSKEGDANNGPSHIPFKRIPESPCKGGQTLQGAQRDDDDPKTPKTMRIPGTITRPVQPLPSQVARSQSTTQPPSPSNDVPESTSSRLSSNPDDTPLQRPRTIANMHEDMPLGRPTTIPNFMDIPTSVPTVWESNHAIPRPITALRPCHEPRQSRPPQLRPS